MFPAKKNFFFATKCALKDLSGYPLEIPSLKWVTQSFSKDTGFERFREIPGD